MAALPYEAAIHQSQVQDGDSATFSVMSYDPINNHQGRITMNTSKLADYSEIIGSIAVVLSLIFVGLQLNEGNRETRAATTQVALKSEMDLIRTLALHAGTWDKVLSSESLASGEEMRTGILLFNLLMTDAENSYHQFGSGYLDAETWRGRRSNLAGMARLPIFEIWKKTPGALAHSTDFMELLDSAAVGASDD